ncbi:MAG TPA: hypothetical protein VL576_01240 [Candidatus Paceibacterota bacterium]|jgi:hypothetical protein|nr:hypothetical protein [Candidatus Paceibacterota bacterium]
MVWKRQAMPGLIITAAVTESNRHEVDLETKRAIRQFEADVERFRQIESEYIEFEEIPIKKVRKNWVKSIMNFLLK